MTDKTPAMPPLPEPEGGYSDHGGKIFTPNQMDAHYLKGYEDALAALQSAQPSPEQPAAAGVSDGEIDRICYLATEIRFAKTDDAAQAVIDKIRAILALRPQAESEAPTVEAARAMGAKGGPVVEAERLAFEAWMAGHCWNVSPTWNGQTYDDSEEDKKRKMLDPFARTTRMLWAAWRDRAALASLRPQAVPMTDEPFVKVHKGEICYKSDADDQSYGMWCPVNWDTEHGFSDGTVFYAHHGITQRADGGEVDRG